MHSEHKSNTNQAVEKALNRSKYASRKPKDAIHCTLHCVHDLIILLFHACTKPRLAAQGVANYEHKRQIPAEGDCSWSQAVASNISWISLLLPATLSITRHMHRS